MLAICRARVEASIDPAKYSRTLFMTYGGTEDVFPEGVYDLCVGNSVVHHILDYRGFFSQVRRALTPEGRALFVEPSAPFHNLVTLAISDLLVAMLADQTAAYWETDLYKLASWVAAVRTSLNFRDVDRSVWEDKHFFSREDFAYAARSAGFSSSNVLPWAFDPLGLITVSGYLREIGVTPEFMTMFFPKYQRFAEIYFQALPDQDKCSMYIAGFHGCESGVRAANATLGSLAGE
jgi:SAM-dependent methyltransferase